MQKSIGLDGKIDGWVDGDKKGFDRKNVLTSTIKKRSSPVLEFAQNGS